MRARGQGPGQVLEWLCVAVLIAVPVLAAPGSNWPQWRGPDGQGVSAEPALPTEWSATENVAWKTPIPGRSHSSPIVWGNRLFLTTAIEGEAVPGHTPLKHYVEGQEWRHPDAVAGDRRHTLQVLGLHADTGRVLWTRTAYEGPVHDDRHRKGSYAAPTAATDGTGVYAYFGSEGLYAYDFDGTPLWKAMLGRVASLSVGVSSSPVLVGDLVIVLADEDNGEHSFIVAVDKRSGREVWRTPRPGLSITWATPVVVQEGGRTQIVTSGAEGIIAYDPLTGRGLWRSKGLASNAVPSPVVWNNLVIVSAGYPDKKTMAIRFDSGADPPPLAWEYARGTGYVPSPIVYGRYLYLTTDRGLLTCIDVETGKVEYEGGRPPVPATFSASPVAYGGHLYMTSEDGDTFVIRAGPTHEVVRTNSIGEPVYASMAIANGRVYLRALGHLYAIGKRAGPLP